jgi:hypothetical protein
VIPERIIFVSRGITVFIYIIRANYKEFCVIANSMKNIAARRSVTFPVILPYAVGRGSVLGIGIRRRLDDPGIKTLWGSETF